MQTVDAILEDYLFSDELAEVDPDTDLFVGMEDERQRQKLVMIPSESIAPRAVRQVLASSFTNIYAEGYPAMRMVKASLEDLLDYQLQLAYHRRYSDRRHYKGTELADFVESLAQKRVIQLFANERAPAETLWANMQALSGAPANNAAYEAALKHGDTIMGMSLSHGGHLTHGSPFNRSGRYYNVVSYEVDPATGRIDYEAVARLAEEHKPRLIVGGASAYPWHIEWDKLRQACEAVPGRRALLMADIAHPAGLVVAGKFPNPVGYADIVTFTTHKTLIGPRGAVILTNDERLARRIDHAVFPGEQGGPHMNNIAALAVAFKIASTPRFRELQERTVQNAQALAAALERCGVPLAYGGTDTHLLLIDLNKVKGEGTAPLKGEVVARLLDIAGLVSNKNTIPGDLNAAHSSAVRLGTTWVTQRGLGPRDMDDLAEQIASVVFGVRPFSYWGINSDVLRGKIAKQTMDQASQGIGAIVGRTVDGPPLPATVPANGASLAEVHRAQGAVLRDLAGHPVPEHYADPEAELLAAQQAVAVMDLSDMRLIEVRGRRARLLLNGTLTANILGLQPGECQRAALLGKDGQLIDDLLLFCLEADGRNDRFALAAHRLQAQEIVSWLEALSDGYVIFDDGDLLSKIDGPAVVRDISDGRVNGWGSALFALHGPRSLDLLRRSGLAPIPESGRFGTARIAGSGVMALRFEQGGDRFELYVPESDAAAVWQALLEAGRELGARAAGMSTRARLRRSGGLPAFDGQPEPNGVVDASKLAGMIDLTKPYFVGQPRITDRAPALPEYTPQEYSGPLRPTCLYEEHLELTSKANMVPFAGWIMPVRYGSIAEEHRAVRETAGLFDITHMGVLEIAGPGATRFLDLVTTNYVPALSDGTSQYSYALDQTGNVLDDVFLYRRAWDRYMLVVNASNAEKIEDWLRAVNEQRCCIDPHNPGKVVDATARIRNLKDPSSGTDRRVDLALQGPNSRKILLASLEDETVKARVARLDKTDFTECDLGGKRVLISRTGYTGEEIGYEIYVNPEDAPVVWNLLLQRGAEFGTRPTGLAARDSTRTEAGFPLYGHELAGRFNMSPVGAGYGHFVKMHKPFFVGRGGLLKQEAERKQACVRFRIAGQAARMVRQGDPLLNARAQCVGFVTSCVLAGNEQIGLAYVDRGSTAVGTELAVLLLPRDERSKPAKAAAELDFGDRAVLSEKAIVIPRFGVKRR